MKIKKETEPWDFIQLPQSQFCSVPGRQDVFVLQLFHFSCCHGDDNVVNVVLAHSLPFAHKPLKGNVGQVKLGATWQLTPIAQKCSHIQSRFVSPRLSNPRADRLLTHNSYACQQILSNLCWVYSIWNITSLSLKNLYYRAELEISGIVCFVFFLDL